MPRFVVLHYTAMASLAAAEGRLCDPAFEVSAHWLIGRNGETIALVPEAQRAWHAGAGFWRGCTDINSHSIGVELDNDGRSPFPGAQMDALEAVLRGIAERWTIRRSNVIGHSDMAYVRKADPGRLFDWRRLDAAGLAVAPADPAIVFELVEFPSETQFVSQLCRFGYRRPDGAEEGRLLLDAFRARFRQRVDRPKSLSEFEVDDWAMVLALNGRLPGPASR